MKRLIWLVGVCALVLFVAFLIDYMRAERVYMDFMCMDLALRYFTERYGRMPNSFAELIASGYLKPETVDGRVRYRRFEPQGPSGRLVPAQLFKIIRDPKNVEVAWGVRRKDLMCRDGRLFYRTDPEREALLIMYNHWVLRHSTDRNTLPFWSVRLYKNMQAASSQPAKDAKAAGAAD